MTWKRFAVLVVALATVSCGEVTSPHPVGDTALRLDAKAWEGTWIADGEVLIVKVLDSVAGVLGVYAVEEKDGRQHLMDSRVYVRVSNDWVFASVENEDEAASGHMEYLWGRIAKREGLLLVWAPSVEKFRQLVESGALPGETSVGKVNLGRLERQHMVIITSEEQGVLFDWDDPIIYTRVKQ